MHVQVISPFQVYAVNDYLNPDYGEEVTLEVSASNGTDHPNFRYLWYESWFDQTQNPSMYRSQVLESVTGSSYTFTPVNNHDYSCIVMDESGRHNRVYFYIYVNTGLEANYVTDAEQSPV